MDSQMTSESTTTTDGSTSTGYTEPEVIIIAPMILCYEPMPDIIYTFEKNIKQLKREIQQEEELWLGAEARVDKNRRNQTNPKPPYHRRMMHCNRSD